MVLLNRAKFASICECKLLKQLQDGFGGKNEVLNAVQALEGLNRLTKGLTLQICTVKRPAVGKSLASPLRASLQILQVSDRVLRPTKGTLKG